MRIAAGTWRSGMQDAWADLGDFVPRLALAVGVVVVGWLLAVVLAKVADLLMERADSRRHPGGRVLTVKVKARRAVPRLVHLAVLLVTLWTAVEVIDPGSGESPAADFVDALRGLFGLLGVAAVVTASGILILGVGGGLVRPMEHRWEAVLERLETREPVGVEAEPEPAPAAGSTAGEQDRTQVFARPVEVRPGGGRSDADKGRETGPESETTRTLPVTSGRAPSE